MLNKTKIFKQIVNKSDDDSSTSKSDIELHQSTSSDQPESSKPFGSMIREALSDKLPDVAIGNVKQKMDDLKTNIQQQHKERVEQAKQVKDAVKDAVKETIGDFKDKLDDKLPHGLIPNKPQLPNLKPQLPHVKPPSILPSKPILPAKPELPDVPKKPDHPMKNPILQIIPMIFHTIIWFYKLWMKLMKLYTCWPYYLAKWLIKVIVLPITHSVISTIREQRRNRIKQGVHNFVTGNWFGKNQITGSKSD